jgi:hypothetical protein
VFGIAVAIIIETVALHFLLSARHPLVAWTLTASSLFAIAWLVPDHRAMRRGAVTVDGDVLRLVIGRRISATASLESIASGIRPTWRDLPKSYLQSAGYMNLMKPSAPNVLLTFVQPIELVLMGSVKRKADRIALHLDAPDEFLAAIRPS